MRVGFGYDIHALKKGRKLILGGIEIPHPKGLVGHSDGDALLHAILDAVLGAAGEGDIGDHFPNTDAKFKGTPSKNFSIKIMTMLKTKRLKVSHIDATVIAESPKLSGFKDQIRQNLGKLFSVSKSHVSVKAKTNEGFGSIGKGEAIACFAVVSLKG